MYFAVTSRKTNKPISKIHYLDYLNACTDKGKIANVNFETTRGLHCHFIIKSDNDLKHNDLRPTKRGWNVKVVPIYNMNGWIKYCRKDHEENKDLNENNPYEDDYIMPDRKLF